MNSKWLNYLLLTVVFVTMILSAGCNQEKVLRVGTNTWPGYETLYLARDLEFFSDQEIKMQELLSASDVMTAFKEGLLDVAALTLDEALSLLSEGVALKVFLVMDISAGADAVVARSDISLAELMGKTIGLEQTAVGAVMLDGILQKTGLQLSDIQVKHITPDQHVSMFNAGAIDAVITFEPRTSQLLKGDAKILFDSNDIPGRIVDVLVVKPEIIESSRGNLVKLVNAQFKALQILSSQPELAAAKMRYRLDVAETEVMSLFEGMKLPDRKENQAMFADNAAALQKTASHLADILNRASLIDSIVNTAELFEPSLLDAH